jgi:aspartyl/asparaginyl beta-hydroxylase (cupin superfamily)
MKLQTQYERFPFLLDLEENWRVIREELENILYNEAENYKSYFIEWPETDIYDGQWDVFGLYAWGKKLDENCAICPKTTEIVERIPGMTMAGFSALAPNTHITPHVGYTDEVYRCHLGLVVPTEANDYASKSMPLLSAGVCALRVEDEIYRWQEGKAFYFDDVKEHEAFNWGDRTRYVLLVDFKRPTEAQKSE